MKHNLKVGDIIQFIWYSRRYQIWRIDVVEYDGDGMLYSPSQDAYYSINKKLIFIYQDNLDGALIVKRYAPNTF